MRILVKRYLVEPEYGAWREMPQPVEVARQQVVVVVPRAEDVIRLVEDTTLQLKASWKQIIYHGKKWTSNYM